MPHRSGQRVLVRHHRGHRLDIRDDGGDGWIVFIHHPASAGPGEASHKLLSRVPNGLGQLIVEAQRIIDRRLDGGLGARDPV